MKQKLNFVLYIQQSGWAITRLNDKIIYFIASFAILTAIQELSKFYPKKKKKELPKFRRHQGNRHLYKADRTSGIN